MIRRLCLLVLAAGAVLVPGSAAAGGGCHAEPGLASKGSSGTTVAMAECAFSDVVTYVDPGERVRWVNADLGPHTVTGAAMAWGNEDLLDQGESVAYTFDEEGVYPYYCALHPSMVGAVVVGDGRGSGGAGSVSGPVDAAPAAASAPAEPEGGTSALTVAAATAAALAAIAVATRYALGRRATTVPAP